MKGGREGEKQQPPASHTAQESYPRPSGLQDDVPTPEPCRPGLHFKAFKLSMETCHFHLPWIVSESVGVQGKEFKDTVTDWAEGARGFSKHSRVTIADSGEGVRCAPAGNPR